MSDNATPHSAAKCSCWLDGFAGSNLDPNCPVHSAAKRFSIFAGVPPAQDSLADQLQRVYSAAVKAGEYDAADWIRNRFWGDLDG